MAIFDRTVAREIMKRLLKNDTQFDAVFAHNDNMILGVIDTFEELQVKRPSVLIGFDAIREAVKAVEQGKLNATIAQKPRNYGKTIN